MQFYSLKTGDVLETYRTIEVDELAWHMEKDKIDAIIDVRVEKSFRKGRIPGSRNFPSKQFSNYLPNILDYINSGVETVAVIIKKSNDSKDIMFNLLRESTDVDILFVNFTLSDWKTLGKEIGSGSC